MATHHVGTAAPELREADATSAGVVAWILGFAVFFVLFASVAAVVGLHDLALADTSLGVTASGAASVAAGVVYLVAAWQLIALSRRAGWTDGRRPACTAWVLVAFLILALTGVYVFLAGIRASSDQRVIVTGAGVAIIAVAVTGLAAFSSEVRLTIPRIGALALAFVGTVLGAWQFWYSNEYAPSQVGRAVSLKTTIATEGKSADHHVVRATVNFEAVSGRSLSVVGSAYTLTGARVVSCDRQDRVDASEVSRMFDRFLIDPQRSRFAADIREQQPATVLSEGKFVGDGRRLEPGVPYSREIVFHVRKGAYQLVRFRAELFAISGAVNLSQRRKPVFIRPGDGYVFGFWRIDDDSWLHDLVYGRERWLVIRYELVGNAGNVKAAPDVRVTARLAEPTWDGGRPTVDEARVLFRRLALTDPAEPFATTELALEDVRTPTTEDQLPKACER